MRETGSPRRIGRSILAVLAGIVVGAALSLGTDALLKAFGVFPKLGNQMSDPLFLLATAYRIVYGILGSYVIARLAPDRPMQHALIGGVLGLVVSIIGAVVTWNRGTALVSHRTRSYCLALRLGGRETPPDADARGSGMRSQLQAG